VAIPTPPIATAEVSGASGAASGCAPIAIVLADLGGVVESVPCVNAAADRDRCMGVLDVHGTFAGHGAGPGRLLVSQSQPHAWEGLR
jgi:septum formation inhibitor-activating ATPase MinD